MEEEIRKGGDQTSAHSHSFTLSNFVSENKAGCKILGKKSPEGRFVHCSHLMVLLHAKIPLACAFKTQDSTQICPGILNVYSFRYQNKNPSGTAYLSVRRLQKYSLNSLLKTIEILCLRLERGKDFFSSNLELLLLAGK